MDLTERKGSSAVRHPWELARAEFFLRLLKERQALATAGAWLDVGSGDAWFAEQLQRLLPTGSEVTCWDINYTAEDVAAGGSGGPRLVAERPDAQFDGILMLDVIEHVEDDAAFVRPIVRDLLVAGGLAVVSVPAYQFLSSTHDVELRHFRRYSPGGCRRLLEQSGLDVISDGGLFLSLLPVRAAQVVVERVRPVKSLSGGVGGWRYGKLFTRGLTGALIADAALSRRFSRHGLSLPGLSYWALCRSRRSPVGR